MSFALLTLPRWTHCMCFFIDVTFSRRELANFLTVGWPCPGEEGRRRRRRRWQREGNGGEGIRRRRCRFKEGNFFLEIFKWEIGLPARRRAEISPFSIFLFLSMEGSHSYEQEEMRSNLSKSQRRSEYVPISRRIYKWKKKSFVSFLLSSIGRKGSEVTRRQKKKVFVAHYKSPSLISSDIVSSFFFSSEARTAQERGEEKGDLIYWVTGRGNHSSQRTVIWVRLPKMRRA